MFAYRADQGIYARGTAFWAIAVYAFLAGQSFYYWIQGFESMSFVRDRIFQSPLPVLGAHLTLALILGVAIGVLLTWQVAWRVVNAPKLADLLIETEAEMKKVTWPSFDETRRAALVVIGCTMFMLVFLIFSDQALNFLLYKVML